ncbi:hypothetical protein PMAYCL1PPCAC_02298, partial [Pristionchus mayeri]
LLLVVICIIWLLPLQDTAMSKDDSILSAVSGPAVNGGTQAHLVKVLANVVETQKTVASQFSSLFERVEEGRSETRRNIVALTDEIKKLEIRSNTMFDKVTTQLMAQNEALSAAHAAERAQLIAQNENILNLLRTTISNAPRPAPVYSQPMQTFNQAMSANAMFGSASNHDQQVIDQLAQLTPNQMGALQAQMRQMQIQQLQQAQQQQALLASRAAASSTTIAAPSQTSSVPTAAVPATPATTPAVVPTQPAAPKVEVKPVVPTSSSSIAPAKPPMFSFSSPAGTGTASKPILGGSMAPVAPVSSTPSSTSSFSFVAPKPATKVEVKEEAGDDEDEDHVEEYEPNVQFTPVIPLPDMVETVTGEESEKVLFEDRCKLFRYANGEWKERATGNIKVLKNEKSGKHRVVVRRDQVHKVAANFNLVPGVKIAPMKANQKAVVWFCVDFSEDEVTGVKEQLSAKFASPQQAEEFMKLANGIVDAMPKSGATPKKAEEETKAVGAKVEIPKAAEQKKSAAVAPAATPASTVAVGFGDKFKMAVGEWECQGCYVRNAADATDCKCCGTANPNCEKKETDKPSNPFGKNATIFNASAASGSTPKFSFGLGGGASASPASTTTTVDVTKTETKTSTPTAAGFSFGGSNASTAPSAAPTTTATPKFSFMQAAAAASKEDEKKSIFGSSTAPSASSNAFGAGVTTAASGASSFSFKSAAVAPTASASPLPSFSFKTPDPSKPASIFGGSQKTLFGTSGPSTPVDMKKTEEEKKETPGTVFGSSFMSGGQSTSAGFSSLSGKPSIFDQQDKVAEGQKNFASLAKSKPFGQSAAVAASGTAAAASASAEDGEEGDPEEYEPDVQFAPVIPLPDLVEVKTGEEDEKVLFTARSKIFRFVRDTKEYKERGVGDLKLLHNEAANKFRVVMRRDQVHKLCANFSVLKSANLMEKAGQPNVRSLVVIDFAENDAGDMESFCIKFKNAEIAQDFDRAFKDAQACLQ